jgi:uncharacterized protein (DUF58 family)
MELSTARRRTHSPPASAAAVAAQRGRNEKPGSAARRGGRPDSVLAGRHASRLRGRGLDFEELRHYQYGDDPRSMDWLATARLGGPYVRVFTEERDREVLLLVDHRLTMFFGSRRAMKSVAAAEVRRLPPGA